MGAGIAAFSPAWIIAVLGLLGRMKGRFPDMSVTVWWLVSGAPALLGVIVTDGLLRRLQDSGRDYPPARYWEVGLGTFFPAWCVALLGLALTSPGDGRWAGRKVHGGLDTEARDGSAPS